MLFLECTASTSHLFAAWFTWLLCAVFPPVSFLFSPFFRFCLFLFSAQVTVRNYNNLELQLGNWCKLFCCASACCKFAVSSTVALSAVEVVVVVSLGFDFAAAIELRCYV